MAKKKKHELNIKNSFTLKFTDNKINTDIIANLGQGKTVITIKGHIKGSF